MQCKGQQLVSIYIQTLIMKGPVLTMDTDNQHQKLKPSSSFGFEHH